MAIDINMYPTLIRTPTPEKLRQLSETELITLCQELRSYLLDSVSLTSGHLASGLGVIELTVALHYCYQTPFDQLIWDVGHQAYPHKILTGRAEKLFTIRKKNGLHPFPWRDESIYDVLCVGHSSTSISAAVGLSIGALEQGQGRKVICVIGDGSMTAGMAFEAMNHAGALRSNMLVILNDNGMSISQNVGGLKECLAKILSNKAYIDLRNSSKQVLGHLPIFQILLKRTEEQLKGIILPSALFEALGFNYIGPVDGHDLPELLRTLQNVKGLHGPQLLHVITRKGKGYVPAERDPVSYHSVPKFDLNDPQLPKQFSVQTLTYSKVFGDWLCEVASIDKKLVAITPAMCEGSGMLRFSKEFSRRYFDVGIAEQHAVTFAAGLAIAGFRPVVSIYSTFLQRAYDQVIHDVALQNLPVLFAIDRGGIVGGDGPTHQGAFDLSYLLCVPNMVIMSPSDENECRQLLHTGYMHDGPAAVRYPRGEAVSNRLQPLGTVVLGKARVCRRGSNIALLNFGTLLPAVIEVAEKLNATVADMRFVKPLDQELIFALAATHHTFITIEENSIIGGAGSNVQQLLNAHRCTHPVLSIGLPDYFIPQGTPQEIRAELGLDTDGILKQINSWLSLKIPMWQYSCSEQAV